jgi:hypothetical protein
MNETKWRQKESHKNADFSCGLMLIGVGVREREIREYVYLMDFNGLSFPHFFRDKKTTLKKIFF